MEAKEFDICSCCMVRKEDVRMRENPYLAELYDIYNLYPLCDNCVYELSMDV